MTISLDTLERIVDNNTYEVKYTFTGTITPECIQDIIYGSFQMSHEELGKMIIEDLRQLYKDM